MDYGHKTAIKNAGQGAQMSVKPIEFVKFAAFLRGFERIDSEELRHAAQVSLWVRWCVMAFCLLEVNYRVEHGALSHVLNNCYMRGFMVANGYVDYLIRRKGGSETGLAAGGERHGPGRYFLQRVALGRVQ